MTEARGAWVAAMAGLLLWLGGPAVAEIHRFQPRQPGTRNLGVWRLTNDPAIRDEANYHNIQCWSPNGRYTCHTHWAGDDGPGGKASAEVHVVDLLTGEDRLVDKGMSPRWANHHNWLFYCHWTGDGTPPYETGTQVIRYNPDTGEKVVITYGMEGPTSLDTTDTWLYGVQRFRGRTPQLQTVRVRNEAGSTVQILEGAPNKHSYIHVNPKHPVVMTRAKDKGYGTYGMNRAFFDLDGSNLRTGAVLCEMGHMCWNGDGQYLLIGNRQACGRPWDQAFPSDLVTLSCGALGDVCPCDRAGRYICGGNLAMVDTRSGDAWAVVHPYSYIIYPMEGDNSTLMDIDPKGSPDGTKIHYHSTRDIENLPEARITKYEPERPDVIHVDTTEGFADSGDLVSRWEVIGYKRKTATSFEGVTRQKYGTRETLGQLGGPKAPVLFPLSAYLLSDDQKKRARPDAMMVSKGKIPLTNPLVYQRQTDCYVVVARLPFAPHLRVRDGLAELIPGELHWETRGYRILQDGKSVSDRVLGPGETFALPGPGTYTAIAVEWSGLESPASLPLEIGGGAEVHVLHERPADFSWTREAWKVAGEAVAREQAMKAPEAEMELVHLHDGVIARETWRGGSRVSHVDLNETGQPIRFQDFENGKLIKQVYRTAEGLLVSEEAYAADGFKTDYIRYDTRAGREGREIDHWWYDKGRPTKRTKRRRVVFEGEKHEGPYPW